MYGVEMDDGTFEVRGNAVHLCESCKNEYPECDGAIDNIMFGDGVGNDNICCCASYKPLKVHKWAERRRE